MWTQADVDALKKAIASAALTVRYRDRAVTYRSLAEMRETLAMLQSEVKGKRPIAGLAAFSRGDR